MRKYIIIFIFLTAFFFFSPLLLEQLFGPPDEIQIPDDALVATCVEGDEYTFIYKGDVIYQYFINDVLQSEEILSTVQDPSAILESVELYLNETFLVDSCTYTDYEPED